MCVCVRERERERNMAQLALEEEKLQAAEDRKENKREYRVHGGKDELESS